MLDQITHLLRLHTIVEHGSLRRAAEALNITQPALSRSLALLEAYVGQPLVERHARGVRPTAYGLQVLAVSNRLERYWGIAAQELRRPAHADKAVLRIGAGPIWRSGVLNPVFAQMHELHPELKILLTPAPYGETVAALDEGRLDITFGGSVNERGAGPHLLRQELTQVTNRIFAREDHPLFAGISDPGSLHAPALLAYPWIVYSELPIYREITDHTISERLGGRVRVTLVCQDLLPILTALQQGNALCLLPDLAVGPVLAPRLRALPVDLAFNTVGAGLQMRRELLDWEPARRLLSLCCAHFNVTMPELPQTRDAAQL